MQGRRTISLTAGKYGYTGKEIAAYVSKEPSSVTEYLRNEESDKAAVEKLIRLLQKE